MPISCEKSCIDLSTATQAYAGIELRSILAEGCVPLRSVVAVVRSSVHNIPQVRYLPQRNATQALASYCEPAFTRALSTTHVVTSSLSQDLVVESNSYRDTAPRVQHFSTFHYVSKLSTGTTRPSLRR